MARSLDPESLEIRRLTRAEFDTAVEWAAAEGWNPGLHDADVFWATDPEGYLGMFDAEGSLVASGSIVSYEGRFGFMGFFIVRPELRGRGIGTRLWFHRRDVLRARLEPGAAIGMDGVFAMQDWYAKGGFSFLHRNLRFEGHAPREPVDVAGCVDLRAVPFDAVLAHDAAHFGCERRTFLEGWLALPGATALGVERDGTLVGSGVIRPCRRGWKIGPLFADDPEIAAQLFGALCARAGDDPVILDVPENNPDAMELVHRHAWNEVFGCARMVAGRVPDLPWDRIYGVTTFELG